VFNRLFALLVALGIFAGGVAMYNLMRGENEVSGESDGESIHTPFTDGNTSVANETNQTEANRTTIPLEKPPFIDID